MALQFNLLFSILLFAIVFQCSGRLSIFSPQILRNQYPGGIINSSYANFGQIPYGTQLIGRVFFFNDNANGCGKFQGSLSPDGDPDLAYSPVILVNRGNCSFVRKARNAEEFSAAMLVIVNYDDSDLEKLIMVEDGSESSVAIPTLMIKKTEGTKLIDQIIYTERNLSPLKEWVVLDIVFDMPHPDDRVEYEIYYTPGDIHALKFINQMNNYGRRLKSHALMTPHLMVWQCHYCSLNAYDMSRCHKFNNEIYCYIPAKLSSSGTGEDALNEGVREICIYNKYKNEAYAEKWWEYMRNYYTRCVQTSAFFTQECIGRALSESGIDSSELNECMLTGAKILKDDVEQVKSLEIPYTPAIVINNKIFRGTLDEKAVFKSICAGLIETPDICYDDYDESTGTRPSTGIGKGTIILMVVILLAINAVLVYCYRKYSKQEMKEQLQMQVSTMMTKYFALTDNNKKRELGGP